MSRDAFGPNLRRIRMQRRIPLEQIVRTTKVPADLLAGLEANDFSSWPTGLFARAYVRQYAAAIGVDPDETVNEFCRWFPEGDRRAGPRVRGHAEILKHDSSWHDEVPAGTEERRSGAGQDAATDRTTVSALFVRVRRAFQRA
jgi:hypothetical protein